MKKILCVSAISAAGLLLFVSLASAAGFALTEQSASALGMASAFTGQADDASAVWYNPAGITQLDGTGLMGGVIAIYPVMTHDNTDGTTDVSERKFFYPIHLYATHKMNDKFAIGLGINNPFGLGTHWSNASETSQVATFSSIETTEFNPNIAYKITDKLSIAAGVAYVKLNATLESIIPLLNRNLYIRGDGEGWGGNAAAFYKATDQLNLGLSYRSKVKINVTGTEDVIGIGSNPASTTITLPDLLQLGSSYKVSDKLTLNADLGYTWWSSYYRLVVQSNTNIPLTGGSSTVTQEKHWKDVWNLRIGGQYKLSDQWKLRAGYLYDQSPVQEQWFETRVPDSDRQGVSIGAGYTVGNITVDVAYLYLRFNDRTINDSTADNATTNPSSLNGTYKSEAHIAGLTIGYKF